MLLKYDDVISMLTVVNILAKDVNYGVNPESVVYGFCDEKQNSNIQKICFINKICNLKLAKFNFYKFCDLFIVKNFYKKIFFKVKVKFLIFLQFNLYANKIPKMLLKYFISFANLYKNLLIFFKRILFYQKLLRLEYG